ncbi:hypothetical protein [Nocardia sp. NPDC052566]|uniref:hypothetical protein n=1 Tax=Nocardia sp. NPDC052566 TaxID=3364330 RepID=UPI0037C7E126
MGLRAAVMGIGIGMLALTGTVPAYADAPGQVQAEPEGMDSCGSTDAGREGRCVCKALGNYSYFNWYTRYGDCVDQGQQYQREHTIREFVCRGGVVQYPKWALCGK